MPCKCCLSNVMLPTWTDRRQIIELKYIVAYILHFVITEGTNTHNSPNPISV